MRARRVLASTQAALTTAQRVDALWQVRLQRSDAALKAAQTQFSAAVTAVAEQRAQVGQLAASNYAHGDPALMGLSVVLNSQDPGAVVSELNTVGALMAKQHDQLASLRAARTRVGSEKNQLRAATAQVASQRQHAAAAVARRQNLVGRARVARINLARVVARNRSATRAAARVRRHDASRLRRLKAQEARQIKELLARRSGAGGGYRGSTTGLLLRPVPGYVTSPYGWRIHPIYGYWGLHDGTDFHAPCGTPERASGSGTVISQTWSEVYGNRLYLDLGRVNGHDMTVVYNHLSSYTTRTGEHVRRGQTVGLAGTTGWSTGCHLHFTVLLDGNPVDPMHYIK